MEPPAGRVLIIEDEQTIQRTLALFLELDGYEVHIANHGAEALAILTTWSPDVIITDLNMPVMTGLQFLTAYHERPGRHAPVIVCTAARGLPPEAKAAGAVALLPKPFDLDDLSDLVAAYVPVLR